MVRRDQQHLCVEILEPDGRHLQPIHQDIRLPLVELQLWLLVGLHFFCE